MQSNIAKPAPLKLPPNPVWRSYTGGSVLRAFRGRGGTPDDHFPEDWLVSTVRARNGASAQHPMEGLSCVTDGDESKPLLRLFQGDPAFWFGPQAMRVAEPPPGVLWKLLDASVRLQFQAHPDREFAKRHLNSNAGKTECWYILGTRGEACVYLGFQRPPTRDAWARMIRDQRVDEMLDCFDRIPVQAGDCYVVPAGTPHAIGAGVFMVELMEPTDWVVRCETVNSGLVLPPEACFMGLSLETCLDLFDYRAHSVAEVRTTFQQSPRPVTVTGEFSNEELIGPRWHEFFRLHRLRGRGVASWSGNEMMLAIVTKGSAELSAGAESRQIRAGETWLLPGCVTQWKCRNVSGQDWEILLAKRPAEAGG